MRELKWSGEENGGLGDGEVRWDQGGLILGLQGRLLDPKEFQLE